MCQIYVGCVFGIIVSGVGMEYSEKVHMMCHFFVVMLYCYIFLCGLSIPNSGSE